MNQHVPIVMHQRIPLYESVVDHNPVQASRYDGYVQLPQTFLKYTPMVSSAMPFKARSPLSYYATCLEVGYDRKKSFEESR